MFVRTCLSDAVQRDRPPASYQESADWKTAQPLDVLDRGAWWSLFHDPQLDALERQAEGANQDLKAAFARLQQARAATRIARADLFPTLTAGAAATRSRTSVNSPKFPPGAPPVGNDFDLQADLSYEFDVWGRVRNAVASAKASQQASAADLAALHLSIQAELAVAYFSLRADDAQQALLDQTVADYAQSLRLTQNLYNGGAAPIADVAQAEAQLQSARTQATDIRLQRAQSQHAVAVLIGANPTGFHMDPNPLPAELTPPFIDPGLPSSLLERRPDVAAAERRVAAANAAIGVARAAYFPVFSLAAAAGFDSTSSSNWLSAPSRLWSVGPAGVLTVFDAGRHRAQSQQAKAVYDEQVAGYRGTVLIAYQEVEDNSGGSSPIAAGERQRGRGRDGDRQGPAAGPVPLQSRHRHLPGGRHDGKHGVAGAVVERRHPAAAHECQRSLGEGARRRLGAQSRYFQLEAPSRRLIRSGASASGANMRALTPIR